MKDINGSIYVYLYIHMIQTFDAGMTRGWKGKNQSCSCFYQHDQANQREKCACLTQCSMDMFDTNSRVSDGGRERDRERERKESHFTAQVEIVRITRTLSAFQQLCLSLSLSLLAKISSRPLPTIDAWCMCLKIVYAQNYNVNLEDSLSSCLDGPW